MRRKLILGATLLFLFVGAAFARKYKITTACGTERGFYSGDMTNAEIEDFAKFVSEMDCGTEGGVIIVQEIS